MSATMLRQLLQSRITYVALMLLGAGLFGYFLYEDNELERVRSRYQATPCEIQSSSVERRITRGRRGSTRVSYHLAISYSYEYRGKTYTSSTFRHADMGMESEQARAIVAEYEPGRSRCYVDPEAPEKAVLSRDSDMRRLNILALFGILTLLVGLGGWATIEFLIPRSATAETAEPQNAKPVPLEIPAWSALKKIPAVGGAERPRA